MISKKLKPYSERICSDCLYFELLNVDNMFYVEDKNIGFCKRRSPVITENFKPCWPMILKETKICGEYKIKYE